MGRRPAQLRGNGRGSLEQGKVRWHKHDSSEYIGEAERHQGDVLRVGRRLLPIERVGRLIREEHRRQPLNPRRHPLCGKGVSL